jgi:hypothetical protein
MNLIFTKKENQMILKHMKICSEKCKLLEVELQTLKDIHVLISQNRRLVSDNKEELRLQIELKLLSVDLT